MSETVFFTSDTHFGHKLMLADSRRCPRPWTTVDEMNEGLIDNWNDRVKPGDRVYHLGDFSFMTSGKTLEVIKRLNGFIHLVRGNHDNMSSVCLEQFESVSHYKEIRVSGIKICMSHYAFMTWNKMYLGSWMLHGHSHGSLPIDGTKMRLDVGIDAVSGYRPIAFEEVAVRLEGRPFVPVDHHGTEATDEDV